MPQTKRRRKLRSPAKQKILLLLAAGAILGLRKHTIGQQIRIIKSVSREWQKINRAYLYRILREFREDKLVDFKALPNGQIKIILTDQGREKARTWDFDKLQIARPKHWDKKWRLVLYDIPEKKKAARDALRAKLKELGLYEWQKSVWVFPYPCLDEIEFVIEFFDLRPYVRFGELSNVINEAELKLQFNLV